MKLTVQPDAGVPPVVEAIRKAKKSIDVCIFRFDIVEIERALGAAVQRGVRVRALIAHTNRGGESRLRKLELRFLAAGITVARTADDLLRYHAKYLIADDTLHVFGFNFTSLDILKSRSFAVTTRDRRVVAAAQRLFEADSTRQVSGIGVSKLIVSPDNARASLTKFVGGAKRELAIYDGKLCDSQFLRLLSAKAARGVRVRIIGAVKKLDPAIEVALLKPLRLHVRCIIRDGSQAFIGSQSLKKEELDSRREVGLLITSERDAKKIMQVFEADWAESVPKSAKRDGVDVTGDVSAADAGSTTKRLIESGATEDRVDRKDDKRSEAAVA